MPKLVYLDTCVFIELLQKKDPRRLNACEGLWSRACKGDLILVTSAVAISECRCTGESQTIKQMSGHEQIVNFFQNQWIAVRPCDRRTAELANKLSREKPLTCLDAIHVATAVLSGAQVMYTYDGCGKRRKSLIGYSGKFGQPPISIEMPPDPMKGTLLEGHDDDG